MADTYAKTPRPPLSPRELAAFERLTQTDYAAAEALICNNPKMRRERIRGLKALMAARRADAAANGGCGNAYSKRFAEWLASPTVACGVQISLRAAA